MNRVATGALRRTEFAIEVVDTAEGAAWVEDIELVFSQLEPRLDGVASCGPGKAAHALEVVVDLTAEGVLVDAPRSPAGCVQPWRDRERGSLNPENVADVDAESRRIDGRIVPLISQPGF